MSKAQQKLIIEQAEELSAFEADYNDMVAQRNAALADVKYLEDLRHQQDATKREAAIQEKIDGIKAGLIPVEELRKLIYATGGAILDNHFEVRLRFDIAPDRIQTAIREALFPAKPQPKSGGYVSGIHALSSTGRNTLRLINDVLNRGETVSYV